MTHLSPTTLLFCCAATGAGFVYFIWHSWSFDRFQSLIPTKRRAFKCGMTWTLVIAYGMFAVWSIGMAYIKYQVGFINVPELGSIPMPFEQWPENYRSVTDPLYYVLIGAWSMILSIHIEETCFWVHLARSIRGQTSHTWLASAWFKLWVFGSVVGIVTLFMVAVPFSDNPQQIETNVFFVGTIFTLLFTISSFYVILRFPILIETVRNQGGSQVVLVRLAYFRRLTKYRVFARLIFIIPFLIISTDGLTPHHDVGHHQFLTDLFIMIGIVGLFGSTMISVFMFFPPSDPAISNFAAGDSKGLLPRQDMSIDAIRSYFEPSSRPPIPDKLHSHPPPTQSTFDFGRQSKDQIRSIVAPFATPPASPSHDAALGTLERGRSIRLGGRDRKYSGGQGQMGMQIQLGAGGPFVNPPPIHANGGDSESGSGNASSAYAWNLLADHLNIPTDAMGLMAEATEMNGRAWKAARRSVEREMYPVTGNGNGSQSSHGSRHGRTRSASPEKPLTPRPSLSYQNSAVARSLPPPLRSIPKAKLFYMDQGVDISFSPTEDSEDLMSIVSKREKR